jgi:hypothetical protein
MVSGAKNKIKRKDEPRKNGARLGEDASQSMVQRGRGSVMSQRKGKGEVKAKRR